MSIPLNNFLCPNFLLFVQKFIKFNIACQFQAENSYTPNLSFYNSRIHLKIQHETLLCTEAWVDWSAVSNSPLSWNPLMSAVCQVWLRGVLPNAKLDSVDGVLLNIEFK